ncbi:MAG: hypothetical protein ACK8QZ_11935, partial [Anaerolineales bacterium]
MRAVPNLTQNLLPAHLPNTPLEAEWRNFRTLIGRLFDYLFDSFFDLTPSGQQRRLFLVWATGVILFTLLIMNFTTTFPLQEFFWQLLNPTQIQAMSFLRLSAELLFFILKALIILLL